MNALISPPDGYDATREVAHASDVLRYLLVTWPNTVITAADVAEVIGRPVSAATVSIAARRLRERRRSFGLPIHSQRGLGYVLLVPVPASGTMRCASCSHRSVIGTCRRLKGRPVEDGECCWGFAAQAVKVAS
jgi:hypothetical protein